MINCSIHNYKDWMEAYLNGNLSREDMLTADVFLQKNPQILDQYLAELEELSLVPENISLYSKNELNISIKSTTNINSDNFTEYFIDYHEGLLNKIEIIELESFLSFNPKLEKEFKIYGSTLLVADQSVRFPDKNALLKRSRPSVPLFWSISAAASILIIVGVWLFWPTNTFQNGVAMGTFKELNFIDQVKENKRAFEQTDEIILADNDNNRSNKVEYNNGVIENKKNSRELSVPLQPKNNLPVEINVPINDDQLALQTIPHIDIEDPSITESEPVKKKGLINKIFSGEQIYIEDYVNATFGAFKNNKEDEDKWVLKVDRDDKGKSKKVKFTSPIFSFKTKN